MGLVCLDHSESLVHAALAYRRCDYPVPVLLHPKIGSPPPRPGFAGASNVGIDAAEVTAAQY